ncbi:hypothetical protein EJ05DRAFT_492666 [Pseudovirgaria hyperparasitica]|uniref:R3H domain-containing protein n=1 Tax=Pseudovirgaria hyperparasitica TaxID=470096 RepID=A0A6A6WCS7_9PEZI|nr:uncharacterized protein EJ05DRAFT_492666 [Pseudovirgaria hyperparasitica]KAF2759377.1 hypothetical protein EJ05DRAFT_492666 [Pseudovirgaria hyperparasitica]
MSTTGPESLPAGPADSTRRRARNRQRPSRTIPDAQDQGEDTNVARQVQSRGRDGVRGRPGRGAHTTLRPMSVPPVPESQHTSPNISNNETRTPRQSGPRRRGGGRGGRAHNVNTSQTFQGRRFGGQLTEANSSIEASADTSLSANATAFVPGQPHESRPIPPAAVPPHNLPRKRKASKSTAPDIATRIHEDIENHQYECAICTNEILPNSKAWSCRTCWTVFHLSCIKKWSSREGSAVSQQPPGQNGELPPPRQWRCPGCNLPKDDAPKAFTCWCEKEIDPKPLAGLPPFSCGQTCARDHLIPKKCPHPCPLSCHAGPCPPCTHTGPTQECFCGKQSATRRCVDTNYESGWSCQQLCGKSMSCREHVCPRKCHEGPCGSCEIKIPARCYCGRSEKAILCMNQGQPKPSQSAEENWVGTFDCASECKRLLDCGIHRCTKGCHPQDADASHCPRSPDNVDHCPCGKTKLADLSTALRQNCEDPIPNCNEPCHTTLACGHTCEQTCHGGECSPCMRRVSIKCRCGRVEAATVCHQGSYSQPQCRRKCKALLNCKRHECGEHCCPGEQKAAVRTKKKLRPLNTAPRPMDNDFEAEHICTRSCGRPLGCGLHNCQELCHSGRCGSCPEAIFHDVACHCGRTVLQPPLPCGTKVPACRFECTRVKSCGHPQVSHSCHTNDEACPKCPFLTNKTCSCGRNVLKNQPCFLPEVRCTEECGRKLKCGSHSCRKICHKPGDCEDSTSGCQQKCGKEKSCGHPCSELCHSPYECKEEKPCDSKILITCPCMQLKKETRCNATKTNGGNNKKELDCNDECARLERNRKLAAALNIDPETHSDDHVPYSSDTLNMYLANSIWAYAQEKEFRMFAADAEARRLRFKPMQAPQRAFIHCLAEDFGLDSESMDPEPHRHVLIFKTPRFIMAPMKTLAESARIRQRQRSTVSTAAKIIAQPAAPIIRQNASNTVDEPYNGFVLTNARFALTAEELRSALKTVMDPKSGVIFDITFLPNEDVVLKAASRTLIEHDLEVYLRSVKPGVARTVSNQRLGSIELCRLDPSSNITRRESDITSNGGWSQVAAKANSTGRFVRQVPVIGSASSFTVLSLSSRNKKLPVSKREESIVDDWEAAESLEEEKEKVSASACTTEEEVR